MSLLLDALKKAADEKNKHDSAASKNAKDSVDQTNEASIDLDLELDDANNLQNAPTDTDNFPTVDENIELPSSTHEATKIDTQYNASETIENKKVSPEKTENTTESHDVESNEEIDAAINSAEAEPALQIEPLTAASSQTQKQVPKIEKKQFITAPSKNESKIENEQALSALINKSNQHSRSEKLKKNITLAIFIILIVLGAALYFFIQMETTTQNLYIAQDNNAVINRQTQTETQTPIIQQKATAATTASIKTESRAIVRAPKTIVKVDKVSKRASPPSTKKITIVHTKKVDPVHVLLNDAYQAFHNEDYLNSEKIYQKALKREPKNRDAILGLSAIAVKQQRYEYARQKYRYLLKLNPRDSLATAGISSIENQIDPDLNESQLKFMLRQQPDAAHLYFALGGLYLQQEEWAQAQSAYFSAWSADNKNADYAYNLAVSLDHLDKKKQALDFYQKSLKLKRASNNGNFSTQTTKDRIATLQANE